MVKIGDFGMSRDVYLRDYYHISDMDQPLPVRWMALESLIEGCYSTHTDVVRTLWTDSHELKVIVSYFRFL